MWLAAFTIVAASIIALTKDNLKARLAYSTISQLSYITLGIALATSMGVLGGGMHIAMHAVGKITLFMCAGSIYVATHKTNISQMTGLGRTMPITFFAFFIGAMSIIGLPPLAGSWSKWLLIVGRRCRPASHDRRSCTQFLVEHRLPYAGGCQRVFPAIARHGHPNQNDRGSFIVLAAARHHRCRLSDPVLLRRGIAGFPDAIGDTVRMKK
jgi:hypothetical protein